MRRLIVLIIMGLLLIPVLMSCSDPMDISGPDIDTVTIVEFEYDTTIVVQVDTLILNHFDTTIVIEHDTTIKYDTTIVVEIDTMIINHYDTTIVVEIDTLYIDRIDTVYIELPPDTVIQIVTVTDTVYKELPPDTVLVELPPDTVIIFDTTFVELLPDTIIVFDTTFVELPSDTVIQIITVTDTVYIPIHDLVYYECNLWILEWEKWADTVFLHNPYAQKVLLGFDRITLGAKPYGVEPSILVNGEEYFFSVYGDQSEMYWFGPMEISANAEIVIKLATPYCGKVASPECHDFLKGLHWFMINADSINYVP